MRIEPQRDNQCARTIRRNPGKGLFRRRHPGVVAASHGHRQIEIEVPPFAFACLFRATPVKGIVVHRIGMDRDGQNVGTGIEDRLRSIAVMDIDVEHCDTVMDLPETLGCQRRIVQIAEASGMGRIGMVTRRPAQGI